MNLSGTSLYRNFLRHRVTYTTPIHSSGKHPYHPSIHIRRNTHTNALSYTVTVVFSFKYTALEQQGAAGREKLERRAAELEKKLVQQESPGDTAAEVRSHTWTHRHILMHKRNNEMRHNVQQNYPLHFSIIHLWTVTLSLLKSQNKHGGLFFLEPGSMAQIASDWSLVSLWAAVSWCICGAIGNWWDLKECIIIHHRWPCGEFFLRGNLYLSGTYIISKHK